MRLAAALTGLAAILLSAAWGGVFDSRGARADDPPARLAQHTTAALPSIAPLIAVLDARLGVHPEKTRFVLELTEEVTFRTNTLADPYRVTVDLPELAWPGGAVPVAGQGLVERYRYGVFEPGTLRIVFDTSGPVRVREAFTIPARDGFHPRLVIDMEPVTRAEFDRDLLASMAQRAPAPPPARHPVVPVAAPMFIPVPPQRPLTVPEKPLVVIDPGHGGVDPGAVGVGGVFEKDITLATARELRRQLEATGRYRVQMTRDKDVFVPLRDRVAIAREAGADLFLSLHADSIGSDAIRGLSVYTLSDTASDREAEQLAAKENRSDAIAGMNLAVENDQVASILIDLAQRDTMNQSRRFAKIALDHLGGEVKLLPARPHRQAGFAVLTAPDVPSLLVEMGYLSSPKDANLLNTPGHRERLSRALTKGIDAYFKWLAAVRKP